MAYPSKNTSTYTSPSKNTSTSTLSNTDRHNYDEPEVTYDSSTVSYSDNIDYTYQAKS